MNGTALVRQPSSRLAEGIVTHISRTSVDVALARAQHAAYAEALAASGWTIQQAPAADDCPDSVFIEDMVVICEDLAVLTRPGAPARRAEVAGVAEAIRPLGLSTACIQEPGVLDGGDVLQAGRRGHRRIRETRRLRHLPERAGARPVGSQHRSSQVAAPPRRPEPRRRRTRASPGPAPWSALSRVGTTNSKPRNYDGTLMPERDAEK
jgi:hypothetical protein